MHSRILALLGSLLVCFLYLTQAQPDLQDASLHQHSKRRGIGGGFGGGRVGGIGRGSGGVGSSRPPTTRGSSNRGGRTSSGSGVSPSYGGYYAGGARVPYRSGRPVGNIAPLLLVGGGLAFWHGGAGAWGRYGAYAYPLNETITIKNPQTGKKEKVKVLCLCRRYVECSCQGNDGKAYIRAVFRNDGDNDSDMVQVAVVNGSRTAIVNGTLANGTTASGAAGGGRTSLMESAVWGLGALVLGSSLSLL